MRSKVNTPFYNRSSYRHELAGETAGAARAQEVLLVCHGGLIVFRCYLRNKTHLVRPFNAIPPPPGDTTSPLKLLQAAASTPGQTQQYGTAELDLIRTRCPFTDRSPDRHPRQEVVPRRRGPRLHAAVQRVQKNASCLLSKRAFEHESPSLCLSVSLSFSLSSRPRHSLSAGLPDGARSGAVMTASVCGW